MAGVTNDGFVTKTLEEIKAELEADLISALGAETNVTSTSVLGQLIGLFASSNREVWEAIESVYKSFDVDQATGSSLDAMAALSGSIRLAATKSTVTGTINIDNGVTVPLGSVASVSGNASARFVTLVAVTNSSGSTADFSVAMEAESTGIVVANASTLTVIETPVAGWNTVTNAADATPGTNVETDAELRIRRDEDLRAAGNATVEALKADILAVTDVEFAKIFENVTLVTDGDGVPGKAFESVVQGGTDAAVASAIFLSKAAGIEAHGTTSEVVVDSSGENHTIKFTRPAIKTLYISAFFTTDASEYPATGDNDTKTAIFDFVDAEFSVGDDVIISKACKPIYSIPGVEDLTVNEVFDIATLGSETLIDVDFSGTSWNVTGDFTDGTAAVYAHSTGAGTLTQDDADFAVAAVADAIYKFEFTITGSTAGVTANITASFAADPVSLDLTDGTNFVVFASNSAPGDFVISATSTAGGFTMDDVSLKQVTTSAGNFVIGPREVSSFATSRIIVVSS